MTTISIDYQLFRKDANGDLFVVTDQSDLDLQQDIDDKDSSPYVTQEVDPEEQGKAIDEHVVDVFTGAELRSHLVQLPTIGNSRWSNSTKRWETVTAGGSTTYVVYPVGTNPANSNLFLQVATPI